MPISIEDTPELAQTYDVDVVNPVLMAISKILVDLGHVTGKDAKVSEDDRTTYTTLYDALGLALKKWKEERLRVAGEADKIADDNEYIRTMDALTKLDQSIVDQMKKLEPIQAAIKQVGSKRKMSRKYCKKTPCRKMGFSQRASCHPYKKCSTRRARRGRVST